MRRSSTPLGLGQGQTLPQLALAHADAALVGWLGDLPLADGPAGAVEQLEGDQVEGVGAGPAVIQQFAQ